MLDTETHLKIFKDYKMITTKNKKVEFDLDAAIVLTGRNFREMEKSNMTVDDLKKFLYKKPKGRNK